MNIIDRYLWKHIVLGVLLAGTALLVLDVFFSFVGQLDDVAEYASYRTIDALLYLVYTLPHRAYDFFPTAMLIGMLVGLGGLASGAEFIAMRAAGVSVWRITFATLKLGLVLVIIVFMVGQWIIPKTDNAARHFKAMKQGKQIALLNDSGLWIKEKNNILFIGKIINKNYLENVRVYRMTHRREKLNDLVVIEKAKYIDSKWRLSNVMAYRFGQQSITITKKEHDAISHLLNNKILDVTSINPELLSFDQLKQVIRHQESNGLSAHKYRAIFWKYYSIPLSALVMLILAIPFLFSHQRSGSAGQRIFLGIVVGIVFYLINRALNELGSVYQIQPAVGAFLPLVIFLMIGLISIKRIH